jgi:hypothetical protein
MEFITSFFCVFISNLSAMRFLPSVVFFLNELGPLKLIHVVLVELVRTDPRYRRPAVRKRNNRESRRAVGG